MKHSDLAKDSVKPGRLTRIWIHKHPDAGRVLCLEKMFEEQCVICERMREIIERGKKC